MLKVISTDEAPCAVGPYSQAIIEPKMGLVFVSGQIPLDPKTGKVEKSDIKDQTKQALKNLLAVLLAAGAGPHQVCKTTIYLKDMNDFLLVNQEYEKVFNEHKPARACVEVARLPKDALIEIDAIAVIGKVF